MDHICRRHFADTCHNGGNTLKIVRVIRIHTTITRFRDYDESVHVAAIL